MGKRRFSFSFWNSGTHHMSRPHTAVPCQCRLTHRHNITNTHTHTHAHTHKIWNGLSECQSHSLKMAWIGYKVRRLDGYLNALNRQKHPWMTLLNMPWLLLFIRLVYKRNGQFGIAYIYCVSLDKRVSSINLMEMGNGCKDGKLGKLLT